MRLTRKNEIYLGGYEAMCDFGKAFSKLGKLEDIEEELGIDFPTLFKAFHHGIYVKVGREIIFVKYIGIFKKRKWHLFSANNVLGKYEICLVSNYGKSWALSKEELNK